MTTPPLMRLHGGVTYGPIASRRYGTSLGVNLLPAGEKVCTFNCRYCQYGWTRGEAPGAAHPWRPAQATLAAVERALEELATRGAVPDAITVAGHGEPTLHPEFPAIAQGLRSLRNVHAPGARLVLLTNGSRLGDVPVRLALPAFDEPCVKLDAVDPFVFRCLNGTRLDVGMILHWLHATHHAIVIQSLFARSRDGRIDNAHGAPLAAWIDAVADLRPRAVHVYSITRSTASGDLDPVDADTLTDIAQRVRARGVRAEAFI